MAVISPDIDQTASHHEIASNDVTVYPLNASGASQGNTILDKEAQRLKEREARKEAEEQASTESERPPGLWLLTGIGLYLAYRRFA